MQRYFSNRSGVSAATCLVEMVSSHGGACRVSVLRAAGVEISSSTSF